MAEKVSEPVPVCRLVEAGHAATCTLVVRLQLPWPAFAGAIVVTVDGVINHLRCVGTTGFIGHREGNCWYCRAGSGSGRRTSAQLHEQMDAGGRA